MLKACPLFTELYDKEIEKIVRHCSVYTFEKNQYIIKDGEEGDQVFVLIDGFAMVEKKVDGISLKIQELQTGDVFGEMALMGHKDRQADVVSKEVCHVLEMSYKEIFNLYKKEPKIFGLLLLNVSRLMSKRLASSNKIIGNLKKDILQNSKKSS